MATPTTLAELATDRRDRAAAAKQAAQSALVAALATQTDAKANLAARIKELVEIEAGLARVRKALGEVTTPADAEPLLTELETKIIASRGKQVGALEAEYAVASADGAVEAANQNLSRVFTSLTAAEAALSDASAQATRRNTLKAKLTEPPLNSIRADATGALTNPTFTSAKARIEADLPAGLIARARERGQSEAARLGHSRASVVVAENEAVGKQDASGGSFGKTSKPRLEFTRTTATFQDYVVRSGERFNSALSLLARVADPKHEPLTAAQIARMTDSTVVSKGEAAAAKEKDLDDARSGVALAQALLAAAILKALAADVDADPNSDADVVTAQDDLNAAQATLTAAQTAFTDAMKADLDKWEASVPDSAWRHLADFEQAEEWLTALRDTDPAVLKLAMDSAETDLVNAELAVDKFERTLSVLHARADEASVRLEFEQAGRSRFLFSSLRGDG